MRPFQGLELLSCVRKIVFLPMESWDPRISMLNSQYNPCIPCLAIALSLPIFPVVKWGICTYGSLTRIYKMYPKKTAFVKLKIKIKKNSSLPTRRKGKEKKAWGIEVHTCNSASLADAKASWSVYFEDSAVFSRSNIICHVVGT